VRSTWSLWESSATNKRIYASMGVRTRPAYAYTSAHYAAWRRDYPQHTNLLVAGGPGENLSIDGMTLGSPHYMTCSQGDEMKWRRLLRKLRNRGKAM